MANSKKPLPNNVQATISNSLVLTTKRFLTDLFTTQKTTEPSVLAAFSGGLDSMVMLDVLAQLRVDCAFHLKALHVHHGLSQKADDWAHFCQQACARLDVPLSIMRVHVNVEAGLGIEAAARQARYHALTQVPADFICLAQHLDDQAETLLLQLVRGAGVKGLSAMAPQDVSRKLIRPFLQVNRATLLSYANARELDWVVDDSNNDLAFDRNFLRHQVLPLLEQRYPALSKTLARSASHFAQAQHLLTDLAAIDAEQIAIKKGQYLTLNIGLLRQLSLPRQTNLVRWWLAAHQLLMPSTQQLTQLQQQLCSAKAEAQPMVKIGTACIRRYQGFAYCLTLTPAPSALTLIWQGEASLQLPDQTQLQFIPSIGQGLAAHLATKEQPLRITYRRGGERFWPDHKRPQRCLKQIFQSALIPPWLRATWPLVYIGEHLVMIPGIGIDPDYQAQKNAPSLQVNWQSQVNS